MYTLPLRLPLLVTRTTSNDVAGVWDRVVQDYLFGSFPFSFPIPGMCTAEWPYNRDERKYLFSILFPPIPNGLFLFSFPVSGLA